ncbi:MAG TPA: hypothetical protein VJ723_04420, partial [Candidatus Angelobacter sp.]|nr:hypothetical protein [Candidatus Angelobacter sp.]
MQRNRFHVSKFNRRRSPQRQSGVALVTALILLLLLTGLSLAMVMSVRSDLFINGYYRNFRGSFYAADSGLNVMRQDLVNQLNAAIPATFTPNTQPVPAGTEGTIQTYIKTTYGSSFSLAGSGTSGTPAASYPETFTVDP